MLQYAVPSAPTSFSKPQSVFAEPSPRPASMIASSEAPSNTPISEKTFPVARYGPGTSLGNQESNRSEEYLSGSQSPALSALASLAASAPIAIASPKETSGESPLIRENNMNQSQYAPAATAGGTQNGPPVCQNCKTSTTPLWRRDEAGSVLCNACGLFLKLHGRARPISLKTDVIKSRNRVKTSQTKKRDSHGTGDGMPHPPNGYPAAHPQIAHADPHHLPSGAIHGEHAHHIPSPTSLSRSNTPGLSAHNAAIAPQHIFDSVSLTPDNFANPFSLRHQSPSGSPLNGNATGGPDAATAVAPAQTYEAIVAQNNQLRTRVSELEVINDLFRGRVGELESNQQEARRRESIKSEETQKLVSDLETNKARVAELEKRLRELQPERGDGHDKEEGGPARKISRTNSADDVHS